MRALQLLTPAPISSAPLALAGVPRPTLTPSSNSNLLLLRVRACGVCHTDLHTVEGELPPKKLPITPGHQVVATIEEIGPGVTTFKVGDRVGVPWLYSTCGVCEFCRRGEENLCESARFTGWDVDGGYADYMLANADFAVPIPERFSDVEAAPLLCAGIIGYRSLRRAGLQPGERLGLFGFGASAHLAIQLARHWGCPVSVFTRGSQHRVLAEALGAEWVGAADDEPPHPLDRAIIFAPAGSLVPLALGHLRKGGTLAINAIHMSPIPEMDYNLLYGERTVRSVANATRQDAREFMDWAAHIPIKTDTQTFPLAEANQALQMLKRSEIKGAAVLLTDSPVRYDTAHGHAHIDISHPDGAQETRELRSKTYREALTMAIADIKAQWKFYRERYER
ncbi:MAG: zinc-dependent alcohol dehydrogenase family protein, partial [Anaerolineales bacterium]